MARAEYLVLGIGLVGALVLVYRLGAGFHGLGRRGAVVIVAGLVLLAVGLAYSEALAAWGPPSWSGCWRTSTAPLATGSVRCRGRPRCCSASPRWRGGLLPGATPSRLVALRVRRGRARRHRRGWLAGHPRGRGWGEAALETAYGVVLGLETGLPW